MRSCLFRLVITLVGTTSFAQEDVDSNKQKKKFDFTGVPILSYNTSYGAIVGANSMVFFNANRQDTISPPSVAGVGGGYSQNKSIFAAGFILLYLKENKWRINAAGGAGDIHFQYYESGIEGSEEGFVDYSSVNSFGILRVLRRTIGHLYFGGTLKLQYSKTDFESTPPVTHSVIANGVGVNALYDTRNNVYYPTRGFYGSISVLANTPWLQSDSSFRSVRAFFNSYIRVGYRSILATRVSAFRAIGQVPFVGEHAVGGKDIRGYTDGRHRGDQLYAAQAEYRWTFQPRWTFVCFGGLAMTAKPYSGFLPGAGAGIRFRALQTRNVNIGIDGAVGKSDHGFYFRIGEVF
jgi:outer membrane protein assembly factor BamA